ncbi:MAG: AMIN domain-containing protein, partial [Pseudanabaena sp.]
MMKSTHILLMGASFALTSLAIAKDSLASPQVSKVINQVTADIATENKLQTVNDFSQISTSAQGLIAQTPTVRITDVKVSQSEKGLEIILITVDGQAIAPEVRRQGDKLILKVTNAVLDLASGQEFVAENVSSEISRVVIKQENDQDVQIFITSANLDLVADV